MDAGVPGVFLRLVCTCGAVFVAAGEFDNSGAALLAVNSGPAPASGFCDRLSTSSAVVGLLARSFGWPVRGCRPCRWQSCQNDQARTVYETHHIAACDRSDHLRTKRHGASIHQWFRRARSRRKLIELERETVTFHAKTKALPGYASVKMTTEIKSDRSPVRVPSDARFVVRGRAPIDPLSRYELRLLKSSKSHREFVLTTAHGTVFTGGSTSNMDEGAVAIHFEEYGTASYRIGACAMPLWFPPLSWPPVPTSRLWPQPTAASRHPPSPCVQQR